MKYPKLKQALLCRILVYVIVIGIFVLPIIIAVCLPIPTPIKITIGVAEGAGLIVYLFKNFMLLMCIDMGLANLRCCVTARTRYDLPKGIDAKKLEARISKFGRQFEPTKNSPVPTCLRYKFNSPMTVYSSGIEKVVMTYQTDLLDKDTYSAIYRSATTNSKALIGKKKALFLDKEQKQSPLNRVTVFFIIAKQVSDGFNEKLYETLCKASGSGYETSILPCVIDLERRLCTFNSIREPYVGFGYPVKNRGIRIIKKYLFGGKFPLKDKYFIEETYKLDIEQSLWGFWISLKKELILDEKNRKKRFARMNHTDIEFEDECVYMKWNERGIWRIVELDEEYKLAKMPPIEAYDYPKANKISKKDMKAIKARISDFFSEKGYTVFYTKD